MTHTCPKYPAGADASHASTLATWDSSRRWCDSRRRGRSESRLGRLIEKSKFIRPQIGVIAFHVGIASDMACPRRLQRQQVGTKRAFVGGAIGPKCPTRLPDHAQTLVVRHSILDYETLDSVRMGQGHAKTHVAPVILHVKRVAR